MSDIQTRDSSSPAKLVTVTNGIRGFFAVLLWWNQEDGGFYEPLNSGYGSYRRSIDALPEAAGWALAEEVPLHYHGREIDAHTGEVMQEATP